MTVHWTLILVTGYSSCIEKIKSYKNPPSTVSMWQWASVEFQILSQTLTPKNKENTLSWESIPNPGSHSCFPPENVFLKWSKMLNSTAWVTEACSHSEHTADIAKVSMECLVWQPRGMWHDLAISLAAQPPAPKPTFQISRSTILKFPVSENAQHGQVFLHLVALLPFQPRQGVLKKVFVFRTFRHAIL